MARGKGIVAPHERYRHGTTWYWSCGHEAGSVCAECYHELAARAHDLAEENIELQRQIAKLRVKRDA